jgi:DNA-binding transcriptional regulator YdaS (Cro superfamily)
MNNKKLKEAFKGVNRAMLATMLNTSRNVIDQIATGKQKVSAERAVKIEKFTNGKVSRAILRPEYFGDVCNGL